MIIHMDMETRQRIDEIEGRLFERFIGRPRRPDIEREIHAVLHGEMDAIYADGLCFRTEDGLLARNQVDFVAEISSSGNISVYLSVLRDF